MCVRELIVNIVTEAGGIDNREGDANTILLKLCMIGQRCYSGDPEVWTHRR